MCSSRYMALIYSYFVILFLSVFLYEKGNAGYLSASPPSITPGITPELTLGCNIKSLLPAVSEVFVIQIDLEEGGNVVPLATLTRSGVNLGSGMASRLTASGSLDINGPGPHLNISISMPDVKDSGHYICVVSITDKSSALVKLQYGTNVTHADITNMQITDTLVWVRNQLEFLKQENQDLKNQVSLPEQKKDNLTAMLASQSCTVGFNSTDLEHRLTQLENEVSDHRQNHSQSEAQIQTTLATLTNRITTQNDTCFDVKNDVTFLQSNQSDILDEIKRLGSADASLVTSILNADSKSSSLELRMNAVETASAEHYKEIGLLQNTVKAFTTVFSVSHPMISVTDPTALTQEGAIVFKNVLTNPDNVYDKTTGEFTAPKTGRYLFALTLAINTGQSSALEAGIKVNGQLIAYTGTSTTGLLNQGAVIGVSHMNAGDKSLVKVSQLINPPVTLKADSCIFTGIFLG